MQHVRRARQARYVLAQPVMACGMAGGKHFSGQQTGLGAVQVKAGVESELQARPVQQQLGMLLQHPACRLQACQRSQGLVAGSIRLKRSPVGERMPLEKFSSRST